jgi:lipopolysaccharide assembly outer membrane protein LptD (OstA)
MRHAPRRLALFVAALALVGASSGVLYAQLQQQAEAGAGGKTYPVDFEASQFNYRPVGGVEIMTATGQVTIVSQGSTLRTALATYNRDTGVATSPGSLQMDDAQNTITGDRGVAYYNTRDVEITGNVKIVVRPKPGDQKPGKSAARREFKEPVTVYCDKVVYNWRTRKAVLTGHLTLKQKDRTVTGDKGLYDGNTEVVELIGNIVSRRPNGERSDTLGANARAIAVVKEGAEDFTLIADKGATGRIAARIIVKDEDEEQNGGGGTVAPAKPVVVPKTAPAGPPPTAPEEHGAPATPAPASPAPAPSEESGPAPSTPTPAPASPPPAAAGSPNP